MKKVTKIKNAIKRKVNESRLRDKVSSILDDALPNILAELKKEEHPHDSPPDDQGLEELDVRKTHGDKRIENPATGNDIKLRTALKAKKGSAVYAKGKAMYNALKDKPTNERAYASTDGKPYFDYDPGEGKLTEDYSQRARNFRVNLRTRLDAMKSGQKIKYGKLAWTALGNGNFKDSRGRTVPHENIVQDLKHAVKPDILRHRGAAGADMVNAYLKFEGKLTEAKIKKGDVILSLIHI